MHGTHNVKLLSLLIVILFNVMKLYRVQLGGTKVLNTYVCNDLEGINWAEFKVGFRVLTFA